ncbi:MAG: molybdate transporter family protein, partial [Pyrinomonadaceae bacterium]
ARTGGSVIIEGSFYLALGLFFGHGFELLVSVFPLPILGIILFFEGLTLMLLIRDMFESKRDLAIVMFVGLIAVGFPYGYLIGLIAGTGIAYLIKYRVVNWTD